MEPATALRPQMLRWAAFGVVLEGLVLFLAFYNAFGHWAAREPLFVGGWLATGLGAVMLVGATIWAWHRQERRGLLFAAMVLSVALLSILLVGFAAALGFGI